MLVTTANDIKIYNLSSGKTLPEWLETRVKRKRGQRSSDNRNIQLLQDFDMPVVSDKIKVSADGKYVLAVGTYKPRLKCFELDQLGLKFERCFDSEVINFELLDEDFSKLLFLQCDRYVEIHSQGGRYYRLRIPKFGRDLAYNSYNCDSFFVGDGSDVHRLNLEQGRFLSPFVTDANGSNVCVVNQEHHLLLVGTVSGHIEAWDPRARQKVATLDCIASLPDLETVAEVTALTFKDPLHFAAGLSSGHVLLYDIRASKPSLVKDHMYGTAIKKIVFHESAEKVLSMDAKAVKIWDPLTGQPYTSIESDVDLNDLAVYPSSGLMFMANEQDKMQVHFIPSLGPAPKWCSFLDNLTDELEESAVSDVYDDYKFVTGEQLLDLGLDHLIGTPLLRAYMHGYFMDVRLYRKAEALSGKSKSGNLLKDKVQKKISESQDKRVKIIDSKLPKVNKEIFLKLKDREEKNKKGTDLLQDDRFKGLFENDEFAIDPNEEAYKLLNPVVSKLDENRAKELERQLKRQKKGDVDDNKNDNVDSDKSEDEIFSSSDDAEEDEEDSSDEDVEVAKNIKAEYKLLQRSRKSENRDQNDIRFFEAKDNFKRFGSDKRSLEKRIQREAQNGAITRGDGHQMTFYQKKSKKQKEEEYMKKKHRAERQAVRRSTKNLTHKNKKFM